MIETLFNIPIFVLFAKEDMVKVNAIEARSAALQRVIAILELLGSNAE